MTRKRNKNPSSPGKQGNWFSNKMAERMSKKALMGVLQANLPEVAGLIGTYYTFKDKAYALDLAVSQMTEPAIWNSVAGAIVPILSDFATNGQW